MDQNQENRTIPLKVGVTELFVFRRVVNNEEYELHLLYGNMIYPPPDEGIIHCTEATYREKLNQFLDSKEGQKYIRPTEEEIKEDEKLVLSLEAENVRKQKKEASQNVQQEVVKNEEAEQLIQNPIDELELINLQKRVKVMLVIVIIQFISIAALVALRLSKI